MSKAKIYMWALVILISPGIAGQIATDLTPEPDWNTLEQPDWLIDDSVYKAQLFQGQTDGEIVLSNGLIRRTFSTVPNGATVGFDNLITSESIIRGVKPEALISVGGTHYKVGGLKGQPNYAFLKRSWLDTMQADPHALVCYRYSSGKPVPVMNWKRVRHHDHTLAWPPKGVHLQMDYKFPGEQDQTNIEVSVHYEMYDGVPVVAKWIDVHNYSEKEVLLDSFTSEMLAAVEYGAWVENREYQVSHPNIHVETDYAFSSFVSDDANHHVVHWKPDPDYHTQVNYLKQTPCLLQVQPEIGPAQPISPKASFTSFRTYILPYDGYDRERNGLAKRRMYRIIAPWTTENPLMMHARFADWDRVKVAIDQASEVGFEMIILTFGSGFDIENNSGNYLEQMIQYARYARSKGVEIGGYSLLASRSIDPSEDVVMLADEKPTFGQSPCLGSQWASDYFQKLYHFYQVTGFSLLEHDGSYPGDYCRSSTHPGHRTYEDSRWNQYQVISKFYRWCRAQGIYLNIPDYYYLAGGNKCGMGYREVNWSLPRAQQVIHTRQNIFDGTWDKGSTMGWMFVPLTEYHGGGVAATIEPLEEHLDHYRRMMISNLGAGVQACYRGPRLFDSSKTKEMVVQMVDWFKRHREVLEGDLIHLRRPDGRDLDYWLMVNPLAEERAALLAFNPLDRSVSKTIEVPLYYAGITDVTTMMSDDKAPIQMELDRHYRVSVSLDVKPGGYQAVFFK